jgi:hypothetical protein
MHHKKAKQGSGGATSDSVKSEMAKPRMAKSARKMTRILDTSRVAEHPSPSMPGTVDKVIPSAHTSRPDKAQIAVKRTGRRFHKLRIENSLTDEQGDKVKLKKGEHVEVTVTADSKA